MMELDRRFATALKNLSDAPPPMAEAIRKQDGMSEAPDVLIFSPAFTTMDIHRPASLLALTSTHWAIAINSSKFPDKAVATEVTSAIGSAYGQTLAVELSILLLDGRLAIHAAGSKSTGFIIYFNTVMEKLYREAAFFALNQIVERAGGRGDAIPQKTQLTNSALTMKFNSALERFTPPDRTIDSYTAWFAVVSGFHRQLSPAAMLVRTENELILISDEAPSGGLFHGPQQNLGYVVTYMPRKRIRAVTCRPGTKLSALEITLAADNMAESITVLIPPEVSDTVKSVAT